jgi:hypothetical protein
VILLEVTKGVALVGGPVLAALVFYLAGSTATGAAACFFINAVSFSGVLLLLAASRRRQKSPAAAGPSLLAGMRAVARYAARCPAMRTILVRIAAFLVCAVALTSLLPYLVRHELKLGALEFGWLRGCVGLGVVTGAPLMLWLRRKARLETLFNAGMVAFAAAIALFITGTSLPALGVACVLAGSAWVIAVSALEVALQGSLPPAIRGRGTAVFILTCQAAILTGSLLWGAAAEWLGGARALACAMAGLLVGFLVLLRSRLLSGEGLDLPPQAPAVPPVLHFTAPARKGAVPLER